MNHKGTVLLDTKRLLLRRFEEKDVNELYGGYINQDEFLYYANKEYKTFEEVDAYIKRQLERYKSENVYKWCIVLKDTNAIIGAINLRVNDYNDSVEFNYAIDNRYINNGYMTEALMSVKEFCMKELKVKRFQGGCCIENIPSSKVMQKIGMNHEGILKANVKLIDGYHDMHMYSLINEDV